MTGLRDRLALAARRRRIGKAPALVALTVGFLGMCVLLGLGPARLAGQGGEKLRWVSAAGASWLPGQQVTWVHGSAREQSPPGAGALVQPESNGSGQSSDDPAAGSRPGAGTLPPGPAPSATPAAGPRPSSPPTATPTARPPATPTPLAPALPSLPVPTPTLPKL